MPFATCNGYEIHYLDEGSGFPVVFIHGLAGDASAWASQVATFRGRHRVIAFDNRGAGRSTQVDEPISTEDMARDTLALLDVLEVERAHIVGRSMGGAIAQHMALIAPKRVHTLTMCASFGKLDAIGRRVLTNMREVLEWRGSWQDHARHSVANFLSPDFYNTHPDVVAGVESLIGGETRLPACYVRQNHACMDHDTLDRLGEIACPTLIMAGGRDPICSLTSTRWMQEAMPHARLEVFEGSSHFFLIEEAERAMDLLGGWLSKHTP
jgi:pimeloyl-ACP methyl ester carboxylesterase